MSPLDERYSATRSQVSNGRSAAAPPSPGNRSSASGAIESAPVARFAFSAGPSPALASAGAGAGAGGGMAPPLPGGGSYGSNVAARVTSVYERRKSFYPQALWGAMVLSVLLHFVVFRFFPTLTVAVHTYTAGELTAIELPPQVDIPDAPAHIARPAMPVVASADIPDDVTIAPTTFEYNRPEVLLAPPTESETAQEIRAEPSFTPYTVAPLLRNRDEAARAILANYPRTLRDAGLGGEVMMWFFIDEKGQVLETRVAKGSGFGELDEAAKKVAPMLAFTPAKNRDVAVPVWVQIPVTFSVITKN